MSVTLRAIKIPGWPRNQIGTGNQNRRNCFSPTLEQEPLEVHLSVQTAPTFFGLLHASRADRCIGCVSRKASACRCADGRSRLHRD